MKKKLTYISLFSSAGIGCFGFKEEKFDCIATIEIIKRRLEIQKINNKCKYESGYINDDITLESTKSKIKNEINFWYENENINELDVLIATPPCQGMSTANSKKNNKDIIRNSLVVESIKLINELKPNFFILENVPAFMKTDCISENKKYKIGEYIYKKLSSNYSIYHNVINFKDYGVPSSRKRCLVIGVKNNLSNFVTPIELFPNYEPKQKTLRDTIFDLPRLKNMGEISNNDILHFFRKYDEKMRNWITNLSPGMSAYENIDKNNIPHKVINGEIILNKNKMGGKYKRQEWDIVAPCIHTRNDQLASQNTIHPEDDRVFSIRELMIFMTIPSTFKWFKESLDDLNKLPLIEKRNFLKTHEINIRQVIGEAVPTLIFKKIAKNIKNFINNIDEIKLIEQLELNNPNKLKNEAFYTNKFIVNEIIKKIPDFSNKDEINILEPSVGLGSFIFLLFKKYEKIKKVNLDVIDIDSKTLDNLKSILKGKIPNNFNIKYFNDDFLLRKIDKKYDLVIGNPPFKKITGLNYIREISNIFGKYNDKNIITYFLLKCKKISDNFSLVLPKNFLNAPQYNEIRNILSNLKIKQIFDFENLGFKDVVMETISIFVENVETRNNEVEIINIKNGQIIIQEKKYIFDNFYPNWIIYRNEKFDNICKKMKFDIFTVYRDRQITNKYLTKEKENSIQVLRSRNLSNDRKIISINNYDKYLSLKLLETEKFSSLKYLNDPNVFICPNFTNNIRVIKKPLNTLINGSLAIFKVNNEIKVKEKDLIFFSTNDFKEMYRIANNNLKNTLNLDKNSVFYFGINDYEL